MNLIVVALYSDSDVRSPSMTDFLNTPIPYIEIHICILESIPICKLWTFLKWYISHIEMELFLSRRMMLELPLKKDVLQILSNPQTIFV